MPSTLPSPTAWTIGGLSLLMTAPIPVDASPTAMLMLLPAGVQRTAPLTFRFLPSTITCGPAGADAPGSDAPDFLLEQPAQPATTMARPAMPTTISRFTTALLRVAVPARRDTSISVPSQEFGMRTYRPCVR